MTEEELRTESGFSRLETGLELLPHKVYMSFDLDVMDNSLVRTDYGQGSLRLEELMKCIALIKQSKQIIGADILGFVGDCYESPEMKVYAEIVASLMQA